MTDTRSPVDSAVAKMTLRIVPVVAALGFLSILDRANVAYAALEMNRDLGFTEAVYGFGAGMFFVGYFLFEVPSNLLLQRFGARRWLARITFSWGVVAAGMALVQGATSFSVIRFLLGLAEAGLYPAVYFLLAKWFPARQRALVIALFVGAEPIALIVAGPLSGWLVGIHGVFGLAGWQLLFLVEAVPTILFGLVVLRCLPNAPGDVDWLTDEEKAALAARLTAEEPYDPAGTHGTFRAALRNPAVWLLTGIYFCVACGSYGINFFLPLIIDNLSGLSALAVGSLAAIPYLAALVGMQLVSRHSDRTGERRWHFSLSMVIACAGMAVAGVTLHVPVLALIGLTVFAVGIYSAFPTFWPMPGAMLAGTAAATGFAIINSVGNLGGFVGPYIVGYLKDSTGSYFGGLIFLAVVVLVAAGLCVTGVRLKTTPRPDPRRVGR